MAEKVIGGDLLAQMTGGVFEIGVEYTPGDLTYDSPASIIATYLVNEAVMTVPSASGDWPLFVSQLPTKPDVVGAILNTTPVKDGRAMQGGVVFEHFGMQIIIRVNDEETGWDKCSIIAAAMDSIHNDVVTLGDTTYTIDNVSRVGGINSLGVEQGTVRRRLFTMNFLTSITEN